MPVSYTHLDVYKRQVDSKSSSLPPTIPNSASTETADGAQAACTALVMAMLSSKDLCDPSIIIEV